ncbi:MAG: hypothetical protein ACLVFV_06370 [Clostridium sp.]
MSRKMSGKMQRELPAQLGTGDDVPHEKRKERAGPLLSGRRRNLRFSSFTTADSQAL